MNANKKINLLHKNLHLKMKPKEIFKDEKYTYREFVTNKTGKAHKVIEEYDKRADSENLIGKAKREGWQL